MDSPLTTTMTFRKRVWMAIVTPGRWARFKAWKKSPATVTRGFLFFRDIIVLLFVGATVTAGVTTASALRNDDCRFANERRAQILDVAHRLVDNDRLLLALADSVIEGGVPLGIYDPLIAQYDDLESDIDIAYAPVQC